MYPHIPSECRTMLFSVASFLRVGSGGKGSPGCRLIFSIAQIGERIESRIAGGGCQLQRDQFRFGNRCRTRARHRLLSHDSPANDQICAGHMAALSEGLDFRCRLKAIVRNGRHCAILRRFVAEMVHGNFGSGTSAFGHCAKSGPQPICHGVDSSTITGTPGELHHQLIGR